MPNAELDRRLVDLAIDEHRRGLPALDRLWDYYRNPGRVGTEPALAGSARTLAQCAGLPKRLTEPGSTVPREVVIENDIAWRVHAMIDFLFGKPFSIEATTGDADRRSRISRAVELVWERSGGLALLQDAALFGHVFGHVDFLVRVDDDALALAAKIDDEEVRLDRAADAVRVEIVEPRRGVPIVDQGDYRELAGYAIAYERELNEVEGRSGRLPWQEPSFSRSRSELVEVHGPEGWDRFEGGKRIAGGRRRSLRGVPIVHVQNVSQPLRYAGVGEVEPLIALQDELNTRLSDRACRVTLQSFQMYLARGFESFEAGEIGPGQVFSVDDPSARIEAFGGDAAAPSEERHIAEVRNALDKISAVPPIAAGTVEARIGNLSSASALRVTMVGMLAKTERKRVTYGRGIRRVCELVLTAFDAAGVLTTSAAERRVGLEWPDPLPIDDRDAVSVAQGKLGLGVPLERVQEELGYVARPAADAGGATAIGEGGV